MTFSFYCARVAAMAGAAIVVTGCGSTGTDQAFAPVQSNVASLSGYRVAWDQGTASDQQVNADVQRLLNAPLSANGAAQIALLNNPDLQATFEEIGISQADLVQAGLLNNPVFAMSLRFPDVEPGVTDAEYALSQDFLTLVLLPLKVKVARANLAAAQNRVTHEVIQLIAQVKIAFYTYEAEVQLKQRLGLIVEADQAGADVAKAQHDSGNLNDSGFLARQMPLTGARVALAEADKQEVASREKLDRLMGLWDDAGTWKVRPNLPALPARDPSLRQLLTLAMTQRRDLLAARQEADAIGQMVALKTNMQFFPASIDVGVDTEKTPDSQRVTGPTLSLELPIFDQGQGGLARLSAQYRQAQQRLRSLSIQVRSEIRASSAELKIDRDSVNYFEKTVVPVNIQAVNKDLLQFNAMEVNTYELLTAKQRELDTERGYIEAWRDYWTSRAELEEAVGGSLAPASSTKP